MTEPQWLGMFEAFVAEKTAAAVRAEIPAYSTELCRPPADAIAIGNDWSIRLFDGLFYIPLARRPDRPACSLVFVQSADGNTGADDPEALGGGVADKHLIYEGLSRVACDAVLAGAHTVRGSRVMFSVWHPELVHLRAALGLPRHPIQIVASLSGMNLDESLLFNLPGVPVILLTVDAAAQKMAAALRARPWLRVIRMSTPADLHGAFGELRGADITRISCVGGRTLARALLDAGLVDGIYLTTGAVPGGEPQTPLHHRRWRGPALVRKLGTGVDSGVVFEHILPAP